MNFSAQRAPLFFVIKTMRVPVLPAEGDCPVRHVPRAEADRIVKRGAGKYYDRRRMVRLCGIGELWPCRTFTSRGGDLANMGRSQVYTIGDRKNGVTAFKF